MFSYNDKWATVKPGSTLPANSSSLPLELPELDASGLVSVRWKRMQVHRKSGGVIDLTTNSGGDGDPTTPTWAWIREQLIAVGYTTPAAVVCCRPDADIARNVSNSSTTGSRKSSPQPMGAPAIGSRLTTFTAPSTAVKSGQQCQSSVDASQTQKLGSTMHLAHALDISYADAKAIVQAVSQWMMRDVFTTLPNVRPRDAQRCTPGGVTLQGAPRGRMVSMSQMLKAKNAYGIRTGSDSLDSCLLGGLPFGLLTEVVGVAGVGKTRLAFHLIAQCVAVEEEHAVLLDVDGSFNAISLLPLVVAATKKSSKYLIGDHEGNEDFGGTRQTPVGIWDNVTSNDIRTMLSRDAFLEQLVEAAMQRVIIISSVTELGHLQNSRCRGKLESIMAMRRAKLLVVDSIAMLAQRTFSNSESIARNDALLDVLTWLKHLAEAATAAVVLINQCYQAWVPGGANEAVSAYDSGPQAALGNTFHHGVNIRLVLEPAIVYQQTSGNRGVVVTSDAGPLKPKSQPTGFLLQIAKSPICPSACFQATVAIGGHIEFVN